MRHLCDEGFVVEDGCDFTFPPNGVLLNGRIRCLDGIEIDVFKRLRIVDGTGSTARVQRRSYNYHAQFSGGDYPIIRYDWPGHRPYHHRHDFDHFDTWTQVGVTELAEDDTPTLGAMIHEVQDWYWSNKSRIDGMIR